MVNKPKNKGTAAETALVNYLQTAGWPYAERRTLQGALDKGDVAGTPGVCWECKVADSGFRLGPWLSETEVERQNSNSVWGVLVCKPRGLGAASVGAWPAFMRQSSFDSLESEARDFGAPEDAGAKVQVVKVAQIVPGLKADPDAVFTYAPPGCRERMEDWYVAVSLRAMTCLLGHAGYGNQMPLLDVVNAWRIGMSQFRCGR